MPTRCWPPGACRTRSSGSTAPRRSTPRRSPTPRSGRPTSSAASPTDQLPSTELSASLLHTGRDGAAGTHSRDSPGFGAEVVCVEQSEDEGALNDVVLCGRVSGEPQVRELPSGTTLVSFRLVLARER